MTECYKLLFDLSLYWTISGYYLLIAGKTAPLVPAFIALSLSICLDAFFRFRGLYGANKRLLRFLPLVLPMLSIIWRPTLIQALHILPVWIYLGWCMLTDRTEITYDRFRGHFAFGLRLLLVMVFGPMISPSIGEAVILAVPTFVLMLFTGVCLLRMLREHRKSGARQALYLAAFVILCAALTIGKAPQLLLKGFSYLYRVVIAPLIFVLAIAFAGLFYGFYLVLAWLVARARGSYEPLQFNVQETAEMLGLEDQYAAYTRNFAWLRTLLIALAIAALLFLLWRVFRRLAGERAKTSSASPWRIRSSATSNVTTSQRRSLFLRPRAPRLAVRYYYARFLSECRRRSVNISSGTTASELAKNSSQAFPGADPGALTEIYLPARYSDRSAVTQEQVRNAAACWNDLKRSEFSDKNKKNRKTP